MISAGRVQRSCFFLMKNNFLCKSVNTIVSNNYFQFKQFIVQQDMCAMKVCTDACVFGAWVAHKVISYVKQPVHILDIGTGTGLLSLMLAQQTGAKIDAVEIEENAVNQARENILQSPWNERIQVFQTAIQDFTSASRYDLIISNPPFYENDLPSADEHEKAAKHDSTLKLTELLPLIRSLLTDNGIAALLLPYHRTGEMEIIAGKNKLYIVEKLLIRQTPKHDFFRTVVLLSGIKKELLETTELSIRNHERQYTKGFEDLLKDYYLHL